MFRATQLLILFALVAMSKGDYSIDDSDTTTLEYIVSPSAQAKWGPFGGSSGEQLSLAEPGGSMFAVSSAPCFDGTFTYAACHASDGCSFSFSFTGSGATIFVLQAGSQGINVSVTIDGGSSTISVLPPVPPPSQQPKVSLFSVDSLSESKHTLVMTVLDWNGIFSGMMLDYIDVHQTTGSTPPSPAPLAVTQAATSAASASATSGVATAAGSAMATSMGSVMTTPAGSAVASLAGGAPVAASARSATPTAVTLSGSAATNTAGGTSANAAVTELASVPLRSQSNIGVVVGGILGGLCILAIVAALFFCLRGRRNSTRPFGAVDDRSTQLPQSEMTSAARPSGTVSPYPIFSAQSMASSSQKIDPAVAVDSSSVNLLHHPASDSSSSRPSKVTADSARTRPPPLSISASATASDLLLNDEQMDLVNDLYRRNIPASAITTIVESMLDGGGANVEPNMQSGSDDEPPRYDFRASYSRREVRGERMEVGSI